ncbi:MAG: hypothetical protein NVS9B10_07160 [Nevskia sp.]
MLICFALLPAAAMAVPADEENARLRAQVEQLKAQLEAANAGCVAAGTPAIVASPAPAAPASATAAPTVPTAAAPSGYKLVKIEPAVPQDDRWKDNNAWDSLFKGMSSDDVEALLGVEHTVTEGNGRVFWGYGKIGVQYAGSVIFVGDRLAVWVKPGR